QGHRGRLAAVLQQAEPDADRQADSESWPCCRRFPGAGRSRAIDVAATPYLPVPSYPAGRLESRSNTRRESASERNPVAVKRKLIEVSIPLDEINKQSAREKSIRHGHPSTLHLW